MAIPGCNGFVVGDLTGDATEGNCYPRTLASPFDPSTCSTDSRVSTYEMVRDGTDEAVCVPDDGALAGVRCCSADGSSAISVCDADACFPKWGRASSPLPASSIACPAHATFAEAEAECAAQNLRLCTAQELYYPGCLSGCGYDSVRIWTSEDCILPPSPPPLPPPPPPVYHKVLDGCWSDASPPWLPHHNNHAVWRHFDSRAETLAVVTMRTCEAPNWWQPATRTYACEQAYDVLPGVAPEPAGQNQATIYHSGYDGGSDTDPNSYCDDKTKGPNGENWVAYYFGEAVDLALVEVINRGVTGGRLSEHEVWYCTNGATVEADCDWVRCSNYQGATVDSQVIEHACEAPGATAFKLVKPCGADQYSNNVLNIQEAKAFRHLYPAELKPHFSLTEHVSLNCHVDGTVPDTHQQLMFPGPVSFKDMVDDEPRSCALACMSIPGCNGFGLGVASGNGHFRRCYPFTLDSPFDPNSCGSDVAINTYVMDRHGTDEAVCVPDDGALAGVRCCSADGSSAISVCDADACFPKWGTTSSPVPASSIACPAHATFAEAEAECAAQNLRLCTAQELYYPGCVSGCGYDSVRIWTSEDCIPSPPSPPLAPSPPAPPPDPFLVVNAYACASPHCNEAACYTNPKTRLVYRIAIVASTGMDAAQRAQVLSAIESALAQFKAALGADALCGVGDSGAFTEQFVDFTPSPPPKPSLPPPSPPPLLPPSSPPPPPAAPWQQTLPSLDGHSNFSIVHATETCASPERPVADAAECEQFSNYLVAAVEPNTMWSFLWMGTISRPQLPGCVFSRNPLPATGHWVWWNPNTTAVPDAALATDLIWKACAPEWPSPPPSSPSPPSPPPSPPPPPPAAPWWHQPLPSLDGHSNFSIVHATETCASPERPVADAAECEQFSNYLVAAVEPNTMWSFLWMGTFDPPPVCRAASLAETPCPPLATLCGGIPTRRPCLTRHSRPILCGRRARRRRPRRRRPRHRRRRRRRCRRRPRRRGGTNRSRPSTATRISASCTPRRRAPAPSGRSLMRPSVSSSPTTWSPRLNQTRRGVSCGWARVPAPSCRAASFSRNPLPATGHFVWWNPNTTAVPDAALATDLMWKACAPPPPSPPPPSPPARRRRCRRRPRRRGGTNRSRPSTATRISASCTPRRRAPAPSSRSLMRPSVSSSPTPWSPRLNQTRRGVSCGWAREPAPSCRAAFFIETPCPPLATLCGGIPTRRPCLTRHSRPILCGRRATMATSATSVAARARRP